jgi:SAM-dependent methyltransferase
MTAALTSVNRDAFAASQVEMTRTWYENLLRSGRDVEAYVAQRREAYLDRWREAGRYIGKGGRVLDIGGGNLFADQFAFFRSMNWDYWYADIGASEVSAARELAAAQGCDPSHFSQRFNHELTYEPNTFDGVFSSHCIEHSMDLALTLRQVNSLLKPGGNFVMSVPFGFDAQPNHPYFLTEIEWMILLEDSGFAIRAYQVGSEYPENAQDLLVAARKTGAPGPLRLDLAHYHKSNFTFHDTKSSAFRTSGTRIDKDDRVILDGTDWRIDLAPPAGAREILPVFLRHDWSGIVAVSSGGETAVEDLFRLYPAALPVRLTLSQPTQAGQAVEIKPVGRHPASRGSQAVFTGFMVR